MHAKLIGTRRIFVLLAITVGFSESTAKAQTPPAPAAPKTIWSFMGIPQGFNKVHGALFNRHGFLPGLEKKPALKSLADPANLASEVPVIKKAAEVKAAEDLKPQKIKAIRYLASIGCGCYDTDGSITDALVAATDDCTEDVRLVAVRAIGRAAEDQGCCNQCGMTCCCNEKILKRLAVMAYEKDETGCWVEPSERVREAAAETLEICCPSEEPVIIIDEVEEGTPVEQGPIREAPEPEAPFENREPAPVFDDQASALPRFVNTVARRLVSPPPFPAPEVTQVTHEAYHGVLVQMDARRQLAHVHFEQPDMQVPLGARLIVYHKSGEKIELRGELEVVQSFAGSANVRPAPSTRFNALRRGDSVIPEAALRRVR